MGRGSLSTIFRAPARKRLAEIGVAGALIWELQGRRASQPALAGVFAVIATALLATADGLWAAALVASVAASAGVALTGMLERDSSAAPERVQWAAGAIPALAVLPVAAREIDGRWALSPLQVVVVTGFILLGGAVLSLRHNPGPSARAPWAAVLGAGAAVIAIGVAAAAPAPVLGEAAAGEIVVATFNLEGGFQPDGRFDPDAAARAIVDLAADVVALQDVPRGRIRDGAADLAVFLERRTGMAIYWTGDGDGQGAAVAVRVEPIEVVDRSVPAVARVLEVLVGPHDAEFRVLAVDAVGAPVATSDVGGALLGVWGAEPRSVLAGSLDSPPVAEPVATLLNGGLFDVTLALDGINPLTWPADLATAQLDYVLISPDLRPAGARVVADSPSNHLPVVARIAVRDP